jgi:hypothetical protein
MEIIVKIFTPKSNKYTIHTIWRELAGHIGLARSGEGRHGILTEKLTGN